MKWLLGAATAAVVALSTGSVSAAEVFKVGLIADFTGAFATWGTQFQQAVEAYQAVTRQDREGPGRQGNTRSSSSIAIPPAKVRTRPSSSRKNWCSAKK